MYSPIRQPAQAEKTDEHSRIQRAVTALGMNYSLGRNPNDEPEIFLTPTAAKLMKMISMGLELLETYDALYNRGSFVSPRCMMAAPACKEEVELTTVQKFQGLVNCLSVLALTRVGSNSTKTIAAFADQRNLRRLGRCAAAKRNLDSAVMELTDIARNIPPVALSSLAPMGEEVIVYTDASCDDDEISLGGVVIKPGPGGKLTVVDAWASSRKRQKGDEWNIMQLEALAVLFELEQPGEMRNENFKGFEEGQRITWGLDNQSDLYGIAKGGLGNNESLGGAITAVLRRRLAVDWR